MSTLLDKMIKTGTVKGAAVFADSKFFNERDHVPTDLPILNIAFSGSLKGGLLSGLTVIAGMSKTFKTMLSLYCMKAYMDKYPEGIAILYDSEFGITPEYIASFGIDTSRVLHIPVKDVEELKFDLVSKLDEIDAKDKVFIMVDSIGNLASKKELEDAQNEKSVADMSRAKSIKSLFRIVTPYLTTKDIPCVVINHIYQTQELYSKAVVSGGTGIMYSSNQVFIISKAQEKDGTELAGWKFTINIEKSRYVREKAKLPFIVNYDKGIQKWDAIFDLALEAGMIIKPKVGWYQLCDPATGEIDESANYRQAQVLENDEFFLELIDTLEFQKFVESKFKLGTVSNNVKNEMEEVDIDE